MLALASNNEIKEMMFLAKVKPLILIPFVFMIIAFISNGTIFLLSISDRFMLFLIRNTFQSIIIRALMVFTRGVTYPLIPPLAPLLRDHTHSPLSPWGWSRETPIPSHPHFYHSHPREQSSDRGSSIKTTRNTI